MINNNKISNIIELTDDNFSTHVENSQDICLVYFYIGWSGIEQYMESTIIDLATKMMNKIKIYKFNANECGIITNKFKIMLVPALIIFNAGIPVKEPLICYADGSTFQKDLKNWLLSLLKNKLYKHTNKSTKLKNKLYKHTNKSTNNIIVENVKDYDFSNIDLS